MHQFLLVGLGSALGGMLRYGISRLFPAFAPDHFAWHTFAVNVIGCFLLGLLSGLSARQQWLGAELRLLVGVGFCGGLTTFSTLVGEQAQYLSTGQYLLPLLYLTASVVAGIVLFVVGQYLVSP